ncbi:hypothetical protein PALU110988_27845 [Paenibacillus lupini]|uniref:hypothetical protein n=1 Tax=Paenibacillus lupini TaxID=1450204 RepID=UPI001423F6D7|nr:hypothetical protein [Paenibacillus lupini]NIK23200.1 hypothetical protein [Paenibacillus lupini]
MLTKKWILSLLILVIGGISVWYIAWTRSHLVDTTIVGVNYQLGGTNADNTQPETVTLKGSWSRNVKGLRTFKGTITFANDTIPVPEDSRKTTIHFDKNGYGPIIYGYFDESVSGIGVPLTYGYGVLFASSDFSKVTFLRMKEAATVDNSTRSGWNGEDGLMFAGPAMNREQALEISNELMKKHLKNPGYVDGQFVLK